uniref:Uncharacterized protein n=1 Tax=Anopheles maculatus TaxID=74869 RepID=A0A182T111_9DIPT
MIAFRRRTKSPGWTIIHHRPRRPRPSVTISEGIASNAAVTITGAAAMITSVPVGTTLSATRGTITNQAAADGRETTTASGTVAIAAASAIWTVPFPARTMGVEAGAVDCCRNRLARRVADGTVTVRMTTVVVVVAAVVEVAPAAAVEEVSMEVVAAGVVAVVETIVIVTHRAVGMETIVRAVATAPIPVAIGTTAPGCRRSVEYHRWATGVTKRTMVAVVVVVGVVGATWTMVRIGTIERTMSYRRRRNKQSTVSTFLRREGTRALYSNINPIIIQ